MNVTFLVSCTLMYYKQVNYAMGNVFRYYSKDEPSVRYNSTIGKQLYAHGNFIDKSIEELGDLPTKEKCHSHGITVEYLVQISKDHATTQSVQW